MQLDYTLKRTKRKSLALEISREGELIARAPLRMDISIIDAFIEKKSEWIKKHQVRLQKKFGERKKYSQSDILIVREKLGKYIISRIEELSIGKNLPEIKKISITKSEKRWGSCSSKNTLCFSYRLQEYRDNNLKFIDAIIIHELAHLLERNHGPKFWKLVYTWCKDYESIIRSID